MTIHLVTEKQAKLIEHLKKVKRCSLHSAMKAAGYVSNETGTYAFNWRNKDWCDVWQAGGVWMISLPGMRDIGCRR